MVWEDTARPINTASGMLISFSPHRDDDKEEAAPSNEQKDDYTFASDAGYITKASRKSGTSSKSDPSIVSDTSYGPANANVQVPSLKFDESNKAESNGIKLSTIPNGVILADSQQNKENLSRTVESDFDEETIDTSTIFGVSTISGSVKMPTPPEAKIPSLDSSGTLSSPYKSAEERFDQERRLLQGELARLLDEKGLMDPDVALAYNKLGKALQGEGRYDEALEVFQKQLEIEKEVFPQGDHPQMGSTYQSIALTLHRKGKEAEAMEQYQRALEIKWKAHGPDHPETGVLFHAMGNVMERQAKYQDAMGQYQTALAINLKAHGPEHSSTAATHYAMGNVLQRLGKFQHAMKQYKTALEINLKVNGPEHPSTGASQHAIGNVMERQGKLKDAMKQYETALEIKLKAHGPDHPSTGATHHSMGNVLRRQGKFHDAMEQYETALAINWKAHGLEHPSAGVTYHAMGSAMERQGKYEEAKQHYQKALEIFQKAIGPKHEYTKDTMRQIELLERPLQHPSTDGQNILLKRFGWVGKIVGMKIFFENQ